MSSVYLDWAASAPPDPAISRACLAMAAERFANPSSIHGAGREAGRVLEESRLRLAAALDCHPDEVVFTSGGTESNNLVLFSTLRRARARGVVISGIEHASVFEPARVLGELGSPVRVVPAEPTGAVDPLRLAEAVEEQTVLVSLMAVNNETGALQPVAEVARLLRQRGGRRVHLHCDAVQAFGKVPFRPRELGVDSASLSAHKIGGPRGVGALYLRRGAAIAPLYCGGGQERGFRPGTENLPAIHAFSLAAGRAQESLPQTLARARGLALPLLEALRSIEGAVLVPAGRSPGQGEQAFSPFILNVSFPPVPGEVIVRIMEEEGFLISTGSACSSRRKNRFRVHEGMGVDREVAFSAVRISIGGGTTSAQLEAAAEALARRVAELRRVAG